MSASPEETRIRDVAKAMAAADPPAGKASSQHLSRLRVVQVDDEDGYPGVGRQLRPQVAIDQDQAVRGLPGNHRIDMAEAVEHPGQRRTLPGRMPPPVARVGLQVSGPDPPQLYYDPVQEAAAQRPSRRALLTRLWERLVEDVCDACAVFHYAEERIFEDKVRPAAEKVLSLADGEAAYIEKGGRDAVIGYKPQLARSARALCLHLIVPEDNAADSTQLVPLVQQIQERTDVTPEEVSTDDGFTSAGGRDKLLAAGVVQVSFSGSNGKKLLSEEIWNDPAYVEARRQRSAVESLIFTLKHVFAFARLRRRGRELVYAELLEKVIACHFSRMLLVRRRKTAA